MNILACAILLIASAVAPAAQASETDAFTPRYTDIEDALPILNDEVNRRLDQAMLEANRYEGCSRRALDKALSARLRRPMYGKFEGWINRSYRVPKTRIPRRESVYRGLRMWSNFPVYLGMLGFGSELRVNGVLLGSDKFGHFFDEGYHYYESVARKGQTVRQAIQYGIDTETGLFGLRMTGVRSYADMVANYNGLVFWLRALNASKDGYFRCEGGQWIRDAAFDWAEYVDPLWDEGVNCSSYRSLSYAGHILSNIRELERTTGKAYACPVTPIDCARTAPKYGQYATFLLSAPCKAVAVKLGGLSFAPTGLEGRREFYAEE